ncbi:MAG: iron-containing alcohol dehydrogenase [Bacteroidota bacterium]|nr:iron-containing alcohol dehydrogenase [Bacteroidota bacterium]
MKNFNYYNPTKIIFGKDKIKQLSSELPENSKVMITYGGGSIKNNGVYDEVIKALDGFDFIEFGGIESNPKYETLMQAVELVRDEKVDFLLAVGGGSVIDGTKFIAAATHFKGDPWDILTKNSEVKFALPLGGVLTIPATGSEMNSKGVITKSETKEKYAFDIPLVFPRFSILDPAVAASLPKIQAANGVVDAFSHIIEQYLTYDVNQPLQDRFAEGVLMTLIEEGSKYVENSADYNVAANIMWAATMALNGLIGAGVPNDWSSHRIAHEITALHNVDHAQTLAIVMPGVMSVMREDKKEKLLQFGKRVFNVVQGDEQQRIEETIEKTDAFFRSLGIKTRLSDYNLGEETINTIVQRFADRKTVLGENRNITPQKVREILNDRL